MRDGHSWVGLVGVLTVFVTFLLPNTLSKINEENDHENSFCKLVRSTPELVGHFALILLVFLHPCTCVLLAVLLAGNKGNPSPLLSEAKYSDAN